MTEYGNGLYARIAEKVRGKFIPAHMHEEFRSFDVIRFFDWHMAGEIKDTAGELIDKSELKGELSKVLDNLCDGNTALLKRIGKRGYFRAINYDLDTMNLKGVRGAPTLDLRWPFALERYILLYPGNLAVLAGVSNSGKTAFVNAFLTLNMWRHQCDLFSSDMSAEELAGRFDDLGLDEDAPIWEHCHERASDYADVIKPDGISVVDYVEYTENVVEIKQEIEEMHRRMMGGRGMCLIVIQKKGDEKNIKGQTIKHPLGYGGATTLSRPKLYLTMDPSTLSIYKAKKRAQREVNPNGKTWRYALVGGARFASVIEIDGDGKEVGDVEPELSYDGEPDPEPVRF